MYLGIFGLGVPEVLALLVIGCMVLVPLLVVLTVVYYFVLKPGKKDPPPTEED
jgi:hypothetical protein